MIPLTNYDFQWARSELVIIYPVIWILGDSRDEIHGDFLWGVHPNFIRIFHGDYPLVICYVAIENDHRNSGFSH